MMYICYFFQIACVSPAASSISETINTLRYAARAKKIRTQPFVIMDPREAMILNLKRRVETLSAENVQLRNVLKVDDSNYSVKTMTPGYRKISAKSSKQYHLVILYFFQQKLFYQDLGTMLLLFPFQIMPIWIYMKIQVCLKKIESFHSKQLAVTGSNITSINYSYSLFLLGNDAQSFSDFDEFSPHDSRPPSQRSKKTLRQVSSFLFISTPTSSGGLFVYIHYVVPLVYYYSS